MRNSHALSVCMHWARCYYHLVYAMSYSMAKYMYVLRPHTQHSFVVQHRCRSAWNFSTFSMLATAQEHRNSFPTSPATFGMDCGYMPNHRLCVSGWRAAANAIEGRRATRQRTHVRHEHAHAHRRLTQTSAVISAVDTWRRRTNSKTDESILLIRLIRISAAVLFCIVQQR